MGQKVKNNEVIVSYAYLPKDGFIAIYASSRLIGIRVPTVYGAGPRCTWRSVYRINLIVDTDVMLWLGPGSRWKAS